MKCVYSAVRNGSLNKAVCASSVKGYATCTIFGGGDLCVTYIAGCPEVTSACMRPYIVYMLGSAQMLWY